MKPTHSAAVVLAGMCLLIAAPAAQGWRIISHDVDIRIYREAFFDVEERIKVDFTGETRHGIFRFIPYRYTRHGHWLRLGVNVLAVTDGRDRTVPHRVETRHRDVFIKIGDPDVTVTGRQEYRIKYSVEWAFNYFDEHVELYWNAIGDQWGDCRSIGDSLIRVRLPDGVDPEKCAATAFLGLRGSGGAGASSIVRETDPPAIVFGTGQKLNAAEGFTIVVGLPKGAVVKPPWYKRAFRFLRNNWPYFLPLLAVGLMLGTWWVRGRDPTGRGTVMVEYEPPDELTPAEVGTLIDEQVDPRDISSTLIDLAVRGYLRIEPVSEGGLFSRPEVRFVRLREADGELADHEQEMMRGLFSAGEKEVFLSELREQFYVHVSTIKQDLYSGLVKKGYFSVDPEKVRTSWQVFAGVVGAGGVLSLVLGHEYPLWLAMGIGLLISAGIVFAFSFIMPRKTRKGRICWERIRGLEEYILRAEKETLQQAEKENLFERLLPYAMALNVADTWARKFEGIYTEPPSWYGGRFDGTFTTFWLVGALTRDMGSFSQASVSRPRTSSSHGAGGGFSGLGGGGFSGGGFGGGGGGAW